MTRHAWVTWKPAERFAGVIIMKVLSYSKFPGVRFPWRVCANSLLARISISPTFSLSTYPRFRSIRCPSVVCFCAHNYFSFAADDCQTLPLILSVYRSRASQKLVVYPGIYRTPSQTNGRHHHPNVYDTQLM